MADNTQLSSAVGSGDTIRTEDRTTFKTPVSLLDVGGTSAEALIGDSGVALPVRGLSAHDAAVSGNPLLIGFEAKDFDGSSLPNVVSAEGDIVRAASSLYGIAYAMLVNEDGSAVGSVNAVCTNAGTFAVQAAQSGTWNITNVSGTVSLPTGASTAAKQPALGTAGSASSDVLTVQGVASMTALKVDGSAVTQPVSGSVSVSGTVTVDSELPSAAALADNASNPTAPAVGAFGMVWDGATWDRLAGTAADGVTVNLGSNNDVTVTGTVTEASGSAIAASLSVVDDWDESDRAKVNLIVGQAGVAAGAGAVAATVQRVTLASDDPAVTSLAALDNAVSGNEFQVDVVAALPTGANTIGDVTVSGAALTALQLIDDAVYVDDADWTDNTSKHLLIGGVYQSSPHTVTDGDVSPALMDANGRLIVAATDNGGSLTVDGTVAATQSGTWTEANSAAIAASLSVVDDWDESDRAKVNVIAGQAGVAGGAGAVGATVQRVTLASDDPGVALLTTIDGDTGSLAGCVGGSEVQVDIVGSLPAGSAAIGKLAANSGVDIGDVDITSVVPGTAAASLGKAEDAVHGSGDVGVMALAVRQDSQSDFGADGDYVPLSIDADGAVRVNAIAVASHAVTNAGTFAVQESGGSLTALQVIDDWDESDRAKVNIVVGQAGVTAGAGAVAANTQRVTLASDDPAVAKLGTIDADTSALFGCVSGSEMQVDVVGALPAGTNAIGKLAANSGVDIGDVDVLSIAAGANTIGDVGLAPRTSGGVTLFKSIDLDESEEEVKSSAGQVYWIYVFNKATSKRYIKLYNATTANVTVGSTATVMDLPVGGTDQGFYLEFPHGIAFGTAITAAATTGLGDADTGAPGANELIVHIGYK